MVVVSCGLIEADYGGSLKHSLGPFLIHEGDQNQTAHAQYRYKSNDIIMTYSCIHYTPPLQKLKSTPISTHNT